MEPESVNLAQGIRNPADGLSPDSKVHRPWSPESTIQKIRLSWITLREVMCVSL